MHLLDRVHAAGLRDAGGGLRAAGAPDDGPGPEAQKVRKPPSCG